MSCFSATDHRSSPTPAIRIARAQDTLDRKAFAHQRSLDKATEGVLNHTYKHEAAPLMRALRDRRKTTGERVGYPVTSNVVLTEKGFKIQRPRWEQCSLASVDIQGLRFLPNGFIDDTPLFVDLEPAPTAPQPRVHPTNPFAGVQKVADCLVEGVLLSAVIVFSCFHNMARDFKHRND